MLAQFVTVWDGDTVITTPCQYDATNRLVDGIIEADVQGLETLEDTYVELPDGEQIRDFYDDDHAIQYEGGQAVEDWEPLKKPTLAPPSL